MPVPPDSPAGVDPPSNAFLPLPVPQSAEVGHGRLSGMRLAVKDVFDVAGLPTCGGSPFMSGGEAVDHAECVGRLPRAGAAIVGKTSMDELAFSLMGRNKHYPSPRNWAAPTRLTGGSSSGSAAAVGANEADIALASDTGGSVRAPASFCGLLGLRTSQGRISMAGCLPLAPSFDTVGWFATSPEAYLAAAQMLYGAPLAGEGHTRWVPLRCPTLDAYLSGRAAIEEFDRCAAIVLAQMDREAAELDLGEDPDTLYWCFRRLQAIEAWDIHGPFVSRHGAEMNEDVRERFEWGQSVAASEHGEAMRLRASFTGWIRDEIGPDGVLIIPTVPGPAPHVDASPAELTAFRERALRLLCVAGLAGLPQLTLPLGTVDDAPFGLSLVAGHGRDLQLLALGQRIMERTGARQAIAPKG